MTGLRHRLLARRQLAGWLFALALAMRLLVPGGYMIGGSAGTITIELCSGHAPRTMVVALPGMAHHPESPHRDGKAEMPCAFAGLAAHALAATDPILLAAAIAFVVAAGVLSCPRSVAPAPTLHLRPPSRGPPAHA